MNRANIKAFIDALIERHKLKKFPVDIDAWLKIAGAELKEVSREDLDGLSGFAYQKKGVKIIGVNLDEPVERRRFTIGHELGHMFLHKDRTVSYDRSSLMLRPSAHVGRGADSKEIEANAFAAELLMAEDAVRSDVERMGGLDLEDQEKIAELAESYGVSIPAMTIRLTTLYFDS